MTTPEVLTVNGVVLNTLAKNIESLTGRLRTPAKRTQNIVIPGRHGALRTQGKKFDQNVLALPMWVVGAEDDGSIPADTNERRLFFRNLDRLTHLFLGSDKPLDIRHTLPNGSVRQCFADVLDTIDFSTISAHPMAKFSVSLTVHDAFWRDLDSNTETWSSYNRSNLDFASLTGATAPMEDLTVTIMGPWTNPRLTFSDGSWVQYSDALTAGQGITLNSGTWSLTGVGGYVPSLSALTYDGTSSHWVSIPPPGESAARITVAGSARAADQSQVTIEGRRKYLVG